MRVDRTSGGPVRRERIGARAMLRAAAALTAASLLASSSSHGQEQGAQPKTAVPATEGLSVAILDLAEAPDIVPPPPRAAETRTAWRTTFGSERQTVPEVEIATDTGPLAVLQTADVVLIQGVRATAPLRRLFPPRAWRLVVSQGASAPLDWRGQPRETPGRPATTAIAVKARAELRITARVRSGGIETAETTTAAVTLPKAGLPASTTAVRLVEGGRTLWLASVSLPPACTEGSGPCPARRSLEAWRADRRETGEATLVGGRMRAVGRSSASPHCSAHAIEFDMTDHALAPSQMPNVTGCISIVRLARQ